MPQFLTPALLDRISALQVVPSIEEAAMREVTALAYDSRDVTEGSLFFAFPGLHADGHDHIAAALDKGAVVIVHEKELSSYKEGIVYIRVSDARFAMSPIAAAFYGEPSQKLKTIGVTGTEGKSTTVYLIFQLLRALGKKAGFISTVQFSVDGTEQWNKEHQTTPEAPVIHRRLVQMLENGCEFAVIEASSHGLSPRTNRLGDLRFDCGVLTNVTHEHLEFHGTWEQYRADKSALFRAAQTFCVLNADDPSAQFFREAAKCPVYTFSASGKEADISIKNITARENGNEYEFHAGGSPTSLARIPPISKRSAFSDTPLNGGLPPP
jgi:UDP-N-acetylmuramoyl-L-alanyl-D-glutamate--2,6-diaminopimelate ligase